MTSVTRPRARSALVSGGGTCCCSPAPSAATPATTSATARTRVPGEPRQRTFRRSTTVTTIEHGEGMDAARQAKVLDGVTAVIDPWFDEAFLGDFPRSDFSAAFAGVHQGRRRGRASATSTCSATPASPTRSTRRPRPTAGSGSTSSPPTATRAGSRPTSSSTSTPPATSRSSCACTAPSTWPRTRASGRSSATTWTRRCRCERRRRPAAVAGVPPRSCSAWSLARVRHPGARPRRSSRPTSRWSSSSTRPSVDVSPDVVWILAVGSDARPGEDMTHTRGDALQLIGMNTKTGRGRRDRRTPRLLGRHPRRRQQQDQRRALLRRPRAARRDRRQPDRDPARLRLRHPLREVPRP